MPLRGGPWAALYNPTMVGGHRTSIYTIDGRARIPARFAIDWVKLADDASHARGDATSVANWHGYAAEVLAVADGTIADAVDDMPEGAKLVRGHGLNRTGECQRQLCDLGSWPRPLCVLRTSQTRQHRGQARRSGQTRSGDRATRQLRQQFVRTASSLSCCRCGRGAGGGRHSAMSSATSRYWAPTMLSTRLRPASVGSPPAQEHAVWSCQQPIP